MASKKPDWRKPEDYPSNCSLRRWEYEFELRGAPKLRPRFPNEGIPSEQLSALGIDTPVTYLPGPWGIAPTAPNEKGQQFGFLPLEYDHRKHIGFLFMLDDDVDEQIERARTGLRSLQSDLYSTRAVRQRVDKYQTYLRLLDAEQSGASRDEMAKFIFPNLPNIHPEYSAKRHVTNGLRAAKMLLKTGVKPLFERKKK